MPTGDWMHPRGAMHGLAHGQIRDSGRQVKMPVLQSESGPDENYPDGLITNETVHQIEELAAADEPFFPRRWTYTPPSPVRSTRKIHAALSRCRTSSRSPIPINRKEKRLGIALANS